MTDATMTIAGTRLTPDNSGALYWPETDLLVVSDLHFEKGSSFFKRGLTLPPYDTRTTLRRLGEVCARRSPQTVIALGDSFHDADARDRLSQEDVTTIRRLTSTHDWIWIIGNHDPEPPKDLGGRVLYELAVGALTFRHEPLEGPLDGEVAGHFHPCASIRAKGRRIRRKCFAAAGNRLIMPAFGAYTGGLNVLDEAYDPFLPEDFRAWMIGRDRVYPMESAKLIPDIRSGNGFGMTLGVKGS